MCREGRAFTDDDRELLRSLASRATLALANVNTHFDAQRQAVNDANGHPQGDLVLRYVGDSLQQISRDVDFAARYGGEEMVLILPHTDLDGTHEMAERVRLAIEELRVPRLDGDGSLCITASVGAAASAEGDENELIAAANNALYVAKREGKNRTVRAEPEATNVSIGE